MEYSLRKIRRKSNDTKWTIFFIKKKRVITMTKKKGTLVKRKKNK